MTPEGGEDHSSERNEHDVSDAGSEVREDAGSYHGNSDQPPRRARYEMTQKRGYQARSFGNAYADHCYEYDTEKGSREAYLNNASEVPPEELRTEIQVPIIRV